ncbi:lysozyme [Parashewanella curva]|uniref:Lysozyme n=1 Tax=Parashewanella curva TaxID=2338552 RepID=A0A3L8Q0A7_9GAMM|nr:lysozyme [Parashewanella curva]RLV60995.1 lysozyme [Parashewanella curva]
MKLSQKLAAIGFSAIVAVSGGFIADHEGYVPGVYVDPIGILTSCYGHTGDELQHGQFFSEQECLSQLANDLESFNQELLNLTKGVELSKGEHAAYLSFIYNVGSGNFRDSTLRKKLHNDDRVGACNELPRWVYASGIKLNGLIIRRENERKLCMRDLNHVSATL